MMNTLTSVLFGLSIVISCGYQKSSQTVEEDTRHKIRINQIGYYPRGPKKFVLTDAPVFNTFYVVDLSNGNRVYSGPLSEKILWDLSGENVQIGDFSELQSSGNFEVFIEGLGNSYPFEIRKNVLKEAFQGSIKGLYYQRAGVELMEKFAGKWHRRSGHPDTSVWYHPSSGKEGVAVSARGWYDAGDYGKYVVNGAFSLGQLLVLYEQYPGMFHEMDLNIPESGNDIPDYLDELKYEMDWLLTMQDTDGGLFFKLTTKKFEAMVMPEKATSQRYIIGKSTTASLDFAACAARAYRVFIDLDSVYALNCLEAARHAWAWAQQNPAIPFQNPKDVVTGQYGDGDFSQEFYWAAAELYVSTREVSYLTYLKENPVNFEFQVGASWKDFMQYLGAFTLIDHRVDQDLVAVLTQTIRSSADEMLSRTQNNPYFQPINDFKWGSNSDVLNAAMIMAQAYRLDGNPLYLEAIQECTDYIFGRNATGYSFLTGFGDRPPLNIHHRASSADGLEDPVPGLLSGGPNTAQQDKQRVRYPENAAPMKSWVDQEPSYASNEICLNWNAPLTYILGFLEEETSNLSD